MAYILLVEDERLIRWGFRRALESRGHVVDEAPNLEQAELHVRHNRHDILILDVRLPDGNGIDFMVEHRAALAESMVIVVTASGAIETAVRAMKAGAIDFLSKPLSEEEMLAAIEQATERLAERNAAERTRREGERATERTVVARSPGMTAVLEMAAVVARSPASTVLITGETGTGKEVIARFIHARSSRSEAPILTLNCATLPEHLVESEVFGHEKGAFTDAKGVRKGLFELADGGTLVLDEVGELPLPLQAKLLRFLEERSFRRVGGTREIRVDVRVIALTNRDLEAASRAKEFRADLFYRLNVFPIHIPPLRERLEDIVPLAEHFVGLFGPLGGKSFSGVSGELAEALMRQPWPGNVRELRNLMERATILEQGGAVTGRYLRIAPATEFALPAAPDPFDGEVVPLDQAEFILVERAVRLAGGNQSKAGRLLGVTRDQVRYRVKRYVEEGRWRLGLPDDEPAA
ncbi:MAG: sigma-54-dependent transcriptional regulator [Thermoanaerobaculia bacterium]